MKRLFWVGLGLGAGIAGAVMTKRFASRQAQKLSPSNLAREAKGGIMDLAKRVSESIAEGDRAMREKEQELRSDLRDAG